MHHLEDPDLSLSPQPPRAPEQKDPFFDAASIEISRAMEAHGPADGLYFLSYRATEEQRRWLSCRHGEAQLYERRSRHLVVEARVGSPQRDNTSTMGGERRSMPYTLPLNDEPLALRLNMWQATQEAVRAARGALARVRAAEAARAEPEALGDLCPAQPRIDLQPRAEAWTLPSELESALRAASAILGADGRVMESNALLTSELRGSWFCSSEGSQLRHQTRALIVTLSAQAEASDGMLVRLSWRRTAHSPAGLPCDEQIIEAAQQLLRDILALREAPRAEPFAGPVLLRGQAAGVWVHEVIGHRAEGHRLREDYEGQTFRGQVGHRILPEHVDLWDDPQLRRYAEEDLYGAYLYDDEGQPGQRVDIVQRGVYRDFLMGRSPAPGQPQSNGHGRADATSAPVSRMSNTVLETRKPRDQASLREELIAEARRQELPFGLLVDDLSGGFTLTGRMLPNSFVLTAWRAWKVYVDGRPDELVRGLDMVGTPLVCLGALLGAGDDPTVFTGHCGAESGEVPVTSISPSLLFSRMEAQRQLQNHLQPPGQAPLPAERGEICTADLRALVTAAQADFAGDAHFVGLWLWRGQHSRIWAELGSLFWEEHEPQNHLALALRLGSPDEDNGGALQVRGFIGRSDIPPGRRPILQESWKSLWQAHQEAREALAERRAEAQDRSGAAEMPDFAPAPAAELVLPAAPAPEQAALRALALRLSACARDCSRIVGAFVDLTSWAGLRHQVDSLGGAMELPECLLAIEARYTVHPVDGPRYSIRQTYAARSLAQFDAARVQAELEELVATTVCMANSPRCTEEHAGPVIFEGEALAELFCQSILPGLGGTDDADKLRSSPIFRLGRRVLPRGFRLLDEPRRDPRRAGYMEWDDDGQPTQSLHLVEDGLVRELCAARVPNRWTRQSNGRGRAGRNGRPIGMPSMLRMEGPNPLDQQAFYRKAAELGPCVIVRRLDMDDACRVVEAVMRMPDGTEHPLRGLRLPEAGGPLRGILATGPTQSYDRMTCSHPFDGQSEHLEVPLSLDLPSLLFAEMWLEPDPAPGQPWGPLGAPTARDSGPALG